MLASFVLCSDGFGTNISLNVTAVNAVPRYQCRPLF